jgi:hypothetical protein
LQAKEANATFLTDEELFKHISPDFFNEDFDATAYVLKVRLALLVHMMSKYARSRLSKLTDAPGETSQSLDRHPSLRALTSQAFEDEKDKILQARDMVDARLLGKVVKSYSEFGESCQHFDPGMRGGLRRRRAEGGRHCLTS